MQAGNCWWLLSFTRWVPEVLHDMLKLAKHDTVFCFFRGKKLNHYQSCMSQSHVIFIDHRTHTKKMDTFSIVTAIVCFGWKRCLATPFRRIHGEFGRPHPGRALVPLTPWTLWCVDRSCHSFRHGITDWCCLVKMKVAGKDSFMFETWH